MTYRRQSQREYVLKRKSYNFRLHPQRNSELDTLADRLHTSRAKIIERLIRAEFEKSEAEQERKERKHEAAKQAGKVCRMCNREHPASQLNSDQLCYVCCQNIDEYKRANQEYRTGKLEHLAE